MLLYLSIYLLLLTRSVRNISVGRAVYFRVHFLVKVPNKHFLVEKYIPIKKKDVYNFFLTFLLHSDVTK